MSDLIDRQAAIDALEHKKDKNAKGDIGGFYNKIIQNDIDALMQLPSAQPGWIPVTERLPKDDGDYLVTKKSFGWNCKEYIEIDIARYENKDGWHKADTVLAWCELPQPWEGDTDAH